MQVSALWFNCTSYESPPSHWDSSVETLVQKQGAQERTLTHHVVRQSTVGNDWITHCHRIDRQWASSQRGCALYSVMPTHTGSISWTEGLSRPVAATLAQFLKAHCAPSCYLFRFHLHETTCCPWCGAPQGDRKHCLFE